ncbi:MAG: NAD-dependent epimerase/dehydratase family protein [Acidobacteriia bacterium]|nr:NAD-dependent epimerase/dehydratase family protein [Terriglobia bacterium]
METIKRVKVGLVGAGYVSAYHARALRSLPFVEMVGIADPDEIRAQALATRFGIPSAYPSLEAMAEAQPHVIHVLTPPSTHAALALQALDMGCHVFVEKPMAETVADCDRMIQRARQRGLVLSVNHSARMDPIVLKALKLVWNGALGEITAADFFRSSDYPPYAGGPAYPAHFRAGSYPFQDLGVHGLYLLEAFLGPIRHADVRYYNSGLGDPNLVFDEWRALVETDHGTGQMYISWNVRPMQNEIVVHGTRGVMLVDCYLQTISLRKTYPAPKPVQRILGAGLNSLGMLFKVTANTIRFATKRLLPSPGIHVSVVKFHEALRKNEPPPVPAEEGRRIIALLEGVSQRADEDKRRYLYEPPPVQRPRILVTGANGFLGRALVRRLREAGEPLRLLVRRPLPTPPVNDLHMVYGDLGSPAVVDQAVEGMEIVFHVGAAMKGGPIEFQSGTIWGTRNIVEACERHGVRKLVYVSSMTVLDHAGHEAGVPVNENTPYEPNAGQRGLYTQTKLEAEMTVLAAAAQGRIHALILRPGQIYGPGTEMTPPGGTIAIGGRWLVVGSGNHHVPFVYVENVVDALMLAARSELPNGAIFQLVDREGIRQKAYIEWVRRSGRPVRVSYVPPWFLLCAGWGVELIGKILRRSMPLNRYRVRSITPLWPCDCATAYSHLGWKPQYSIQEGLAITFPPKETQGPPPAKP